MDKIQCFEVTQTESSYQNDVASCPSPPYFEVNFALNCDHSKQALTCLKCFQMLSVNVLVVHFGCTSTSPSGDLGQIWAISVRFKIASLGCLPALSPDAAKLLEYLLKYLQSAASLPLYPEGNV